MSAETDPAPATADQPHWLTPGVGGIGIASLLSDLGHEVGIGCAETAETAAVAQLAPDQLRGSAFGLLAGLQAVGNLAASAIAGILWTAVSPTAAFLSVAAWMLLAFAGLLLAALPDRSTIT